MPKISRLKLWRAVQWSAKATFQGFSKIPRHSASKNISICSVSEKRKDSCSIQARRFVKLPSPAASTIPIIFPHSSNPCTVFRRLDSDGQIDSCDQGAFSLRTQKNGAKKRKKYLCFYLKIDEKPYKINVRGTVLFERCPFFVRFCLNATASYKPLKANFRKCGRAISPKRLSVSSSCACKPSCKLVSRSRNCWR